MYRCRDCQKEYSQKVEYCDCGNNTFDYIEDVTSPKTAIREPFTAKEKSAIVSQIFFLVCLILSVVVWIIPVKTQTPSEENPAPKVTETKAFPSIDKIWNSTPPKQEIPQPKVQPVPEQIVIVPPTPIQTKPVQTQPKPAQTQTKPAQTTQTKPTQAKPVQAQTKPAQTQTTQKPAQTQTKPTTQTQTKPVTQMQSTTQKPVQTNTQQASTQTQTQTKPATQTPTKPQTQQTYNPNSPTMLKYKGELRSAMFKKLPVGSIQGSGTCSVQFSVDSTGKLINRSFAQKSDNKTINDAVYYMMMSVPRFNPPPAEYNGSLIKMYFKFYDGSYEISIY